MSMRQHIVVLPWILLLDKHPNSRHEESPGLNVEIHLVGLIDDNSV